MKIMTWRPGKIIGEIRKKVHLQPYEMELKTYHNIVEIEYSPMGWEENIPWVAELVDVNGREYRAEYVDEVECKKSIQIIESDFSPDYDYIRFATPVTVEEQESDVAGYIKLVIK